MPCAALLAAFAPPSPTVGPATPPIESAPAPERWVVEWKTGLCALSRNPDWAAPENVVVTWQPGDRTIDLFWVDRSWDDGSRPRAPMLVLEPSKVRLSWAAFEARPGSGIMAKDLSHLVLNQLAGASALRLEDGGANVREVSFPEAGATVRALRECNDRALQTWGVDRAFLASLRQIPRPIGDHRLWVRSEDYPASALRSEAEGVVVAKLTIGPDGRVSGCVTAHSSGDTSLDSATCRTFVARGQFSPAIGSDGAPVEAPVFMRLVWRIRE